MLTWRGLGTSLAIIVCMVVSMPAWAQFKARVGLDSSGKTVTINGEAAIGFHASNGALSAAQRAQITADRLRQFVAEGASPKIISARGSRYQASVRAGDRLICVVMPADANAHGTNPLGLAGIWAANTRRLLSMPPIALSTKQLTVPLGENRRVEVGGAAAGPIYAVIDSPSIAAVAADTDTRSVQLTGLSVGQAVVEVSIEGERAVLTVVVKKFAGRVPGTTITQVTGAPCPASMITYAARQALLSGAALEPGARIDVGPIEWGKQSLGVGQTRRTKVDVKISGEGYITYATQAVVEVRNVDMPRDQVEQLFYSNDPERLMKYQTLFAGQFDSGKATRVLYHHQNMMSKRVHLIVELVNPGETAAAVRIYRGVASPSVDTVAVGHIAGSSFLRNYQSNVSVVETIPAGSRLVLVSDMLRHTETASGILQVKQTEGERVFVRITAAEPYVDDVTRGTIAAAPNPLMLRMSDHIYPSPAKSLEVDYEVGKRWAFIPIGKHALDDTTAQKKLYGNYGVTYNINLKVENPTAETKSVKVLFDPSAGIASGVFIIDGQFVLARNAQPPSEVPLASYQLKPGEVRNVRIVTVPVAGSNYPATLVVRS